ncbi:MAG: Unknown protein [uncultured Sulfurovum sp.]|uniref:Uncharacterized protein n=1 Tax=uncultured Sulfurovum sp. TaxID=269237 RepID=A0A6S6RYF6_9BACT|nr:MAG: Unknown protein [uncultured Sulfurovum sp.]
MKKFDFEKLEFVDSFVVFLDILGFRELVMSDNESKLQTINSHFYMIEIGLNKIREELIQEFELNLAIDRQFKLDYIIISDSIIITMKMIKYDFSDMPEEQFKSLQKYFNDTNEFKKIKKKKEIQKDIYLAVNEMINLHNVLNKAAFEKLCEVVVKSQRYLASQNVWLRGAISAGTTHISQNKKQIIGKAYIKAYELEGKAKFPRVVLDTNILEALNIKSEDEFIKTVPYMFSWNETSLEKDMPLFLDYVGFLIYIPTDENKKFLNQIIESLIKDFQVTKGLSYHDKYFWSLEYMQVCLKRGGEDYNDLLHRLNEIKDK